MKYIHKTIKTWDLVGFMKSKGLSYRELGKKLGTNHGYIWQAAKEYKIVSEKFKNRIKNI